MAVTDTNTIDGIAYEKDNHLLILQIYDHLGFEREIEYERMLILQDKLNAYIRFIESEQYKEVYPDVDFSGYKYEITICFKFEPTQFCRDYINHANNRLWEANISVKCDR